MATAPLRPDSLPLTSNDDDGGDDHDDDDDDCDDGDGELSHVLINLIALSLQV